MKKSLIAGVLLAAAAAAQAVVSIYQANGIYRHDDATTVTATMLDAYRDKVYQVIVTNAVSVEAYAFANCTNLDCVMLSPAMDDPNAIGTNAFINCTNCRRVAALGVTFPGADQVPNFPYGAPRVPGRNPQMLFVFGNGDFGEWGQGVNVGAR